MARGLALSIALLSAATAADIAPPLGPVCHSDSECVITTFGGCCEGCRCPRGPHAVLSSDLKTQRDRCALIDCAAPKCRELDCPRMESAESFRAVCRKGSCEAERVGPATECRIDADCAIIYPSQSCPPGPCGCCPGTEPRAVPADQAGTAIPLTRTEAPRPVEKPQTREEGVKFGLTPGPGGSRPPPPPVNCSPCRAPRPATAACASGRCIIAPTRPRPLPPG